MRFPPSLLRRCWFLAGPTACGKSETSLVLAEKLRAEILSLDSMALFRGMDIGTAKPSRAARERTPHHLIDILDPHEEFSTADYVVAAEIACREIVDRGNVPLFVGGTGLYLRSLLRGVFEGPPADWKLRHELEAEASAREPGHLHARLLEIDPATANRLHPHDTRRIIRAIEVARLTGEPLSSQQRQNSLPIESRPRHVYWLHPPRDWLYARIDRRVDEMLATGFVEEVRHLRNLPRPLGRTARQALGYKELLDALESDPALESEEDFDAAIERIKSRTRQFAKRQHTWFRNLEECRPIETTGSESPVELATRILTIADTGEPSA